MTSIIAFNCYGDKVLDIRKHWDSIQGLQMSSKLLLQNRRKNDRSFCSSAQSYRDLPIRARITFGRITIVLSVIIWRMIKLSRGACRVKVDSRLVWIRPRSKIESYQKKVSLSLSWPQDVIRLSFSHILSTFNSILNRAKKIYKILTRPQNVFFPAKFWRRNKLSSIKRNAINCEEVKRLNFWRDEKTTYSFKFWRDLWREIGENSRVDAGEVSHQASRQKQNPWLGF